MNLIKNYSEKDIELYNKNFKSIMENIRDFIFLHYITKKRNSRFWKDVSSISAPEKLKNRLDSWQNRLPISEDFFDESRYSLFSSSNYIIVMNGLGLFNRENILKEFNSSSDESKILAESFINEFKLFEKNTKKITHKEMIRIIREVL
jgi:tryptophan halogenase